MCIKNTPLRLIRLQKNISKDDSVIVVGADKI